MGLKQFYIVFGYQKHARQKHARTGVVVFHLMLEDILKHGAIFIDLLYFGHGYITLVNAFGPLVTLAMC